MDLSIDYNQTRQIGNSIIEKEKEFSAVLNKAINEMGEFLINAANTYQRVNETNQDGIM